MAVRLSALRAGCPLPPGRFLELISVTACTLLEDICDKPIVIQSYCAVARLHGLRGKETDDLLREIEWINSYIYFNFRVAPTVQHRPPVIG
jgi:hypothetical protein